MRVLGIETTCDESAASVVQLREEGGGDILSNEIMSQIADHAVFGGVVPEIAARAHVEVIDRLVERALRTAGMELEDLDGIAAAAGPGLVGGVMVGLTTGKALALALRKPLVAVNHLEGHALTARLTDNIAFPYLLLLVSGGHTQLIAVRGIGDYKRLGTTVDDAVGEAFDKTAKLLGLGYPGGPAVERAAETGNPSRFALPRPMLGRPKPDFSLSGLKTAVRLEAERAAPLNPAGVSDLCAGFQAAIVDVLIDRSRVALRAFREIAGRPSAIVVAGGGRVEPRGSQRLRALRRRERHPARSAPVDPLHRQRRDDRLGWDRAPAAGSRGRSHGAPPGRAGRSTLWPSGSAAAAPDGRRRRTPPSRRRRGRRGLGARRWPMWRRGRVAGSICSAATPGARPPCGSGARTSAACPASGSTTRWHRRPIPMCSVPQLSC